MLCPHARQLRQHLWGGAPGRLVFNVRHVILIMQTMLRSTGPSVGAWMSAILFSCVKGWDWKGVQAPRHASFLLLQRLREWLDTQALGVKVQGLARRDEFSLYFQVRGWEIEGGGDGHIEAGGVSTPQDCVYRMHMRTIFHCRFRALLWRSSLSRAWGGPRSVQG